MAYTITVDTSDILDGDRIDADDVLKALADLQDAIETLGAVASFQVCDGRLTLTSGTAVTITDVTAATNVYFIPYKGNHIAIYDGSAWVLFSFSELTLSLSGLTASKPHDVFIYSNAGVLTLEAVEWTSDIARATALVRQDGVYCKSGTLTKRYLGTFRTTGTIGQTEDSFTKRFLWNYYNRVPRILQVREATDSWTYATASFAALNTPSTANRIEFVRGQNEDPVKLDYQGEIAQTGSVAGAVAFGLDSTTTVAAGSTIGRAGHTLVGPITASYRDYPSAGYHFVQVLQYASGATVTFYGDAGNTFTLSGAAGELAG